MAAALENTQDIAGLGSFPAQERIEFGNDTFDASFLKSRLWRRLDRLRQSVAGVDFSGTCDFFLVRAVCCEGQLPLQSLRSLLCSWKGTQHTRHGHRARTM